MCGLLCHSTTYAFQISENVIYVGERKVPDQNMQETYLWLKTVLLRNTQIISMKVIKLTSWILYIYLTHECNSAQL